MTDESNDKQNGFSRFAAFGKSLQDSAKEVAAKAAAQVEAVKQKDSEKAAVTAAATTPTSLASLQSDKVGKEELLEILQKLNKKVKVLTTVRQQLTEKVEQEKKQKEQIVSLVQEEILQNAASIKLDDQVVSQIQKAWRQVEEQQNLTLQSLQSEFQRVQQEQRPDFEAEKRALEETHLEQMQQLKDSLQKRHAEEMASGGNGSSSVPADEIKKIKEAAAAQLQAFKKKVATARTAELQKLKGEMAEQAKTNLEAKLAELVEKHSVEMASCRSQVNSDSQNLDDIQAKHAEEIDKIREEYEAAKSTAIDQVRQQVEQTVTTDMEERLQEQIGEIRRAHESEMEALRSDLLAKVQTAGSQASTISQGYENEIASLKNALKSAEESHESAMKELQHQLDSSLAAKDADSAKEKESLVAKVAQEKESKLKELEAALVAEQTQIREVLIAEKEELRASMQQEMETAVQAARSSVSEEQSKAVELLRQQLEQKASEELRSLESTKADELSSERDSFQHALTAKEAEFDEIKSRLMEEHEQRKKDALVALEEDLNGKHKSECDELERKLEQHARDFEKSGVDRVELAVQEAQKTADEKYANDVSRMQKEMEAVSKTAEEEKLLLSEKLEKAVARENEQISRLESVTAELAQFKTEVSIKHKQEIKDIQDDFAKEKQALESNMQGQLQSMVEQAQSSASGEQEQAMVALRQEYELKLEQQRKTLEQKYEGIAADTKAQLLVEMEAREQELAVSHGDAMAALRKEKSEIEEASKLEHDRLLAQIMEVEAASQKELAQKTDGNAELRSGMESLRQKVDTLQKELERASGDSDSKDKELVALRESLSSSEAAISSIESNHKAAIEELQKNQLSSGAKIEEAVLAAEKEVTEAKDNEIMRIQTEFEAKLDVVRKQAAERDSEVEQLKTELLDMSNSKTDLVREREDEISRLKTEVSEKADAASKRDAEVSEKFTKIKAIFAQKIKKMQEDAESKISAMEKEQHVLSEQNELLQKASTGAENTAAIVESLQEKLANAEQSLASQKTNYEALRQELDRSTAESKTRMESAQAEIASLTQQLADGSAAGDQSEKIQALESQIAAAKETQMKEADALKKDHEMAMENLKGQYEADALAKDTSWNAKLLDSSAEQKRNHEAEKEALREKMATHVDTLQSQFKEKLSASSEKSSSKLGRLQAAGKEKDEKVAKLVGKLKSLTATLSSLKDDNEALKAKVSSQSESIETLRKENVETAENSSTTMTELLQRQETLENEKKSLQTTLKQTAAARDANSNKVDELSGKLAALSANLDGVSAEREELDGKIHEMEQQLVRLKASDVEAAELRQQVTKLKLDLSKSENVAVRLQGEKDTNDRNHGEQTALVGMLETQLSEMNDQNASTNAKLEAALYDLSQKDEQLQMTIEDQARTTSELENTRIQVDQLKESLSTAQKGADAKGTKMVESLQRELQAAKQQMAKKSAAAQRLLQQRETECADLRKSNKVLQQEVDKGSFGDRHIFELAAKQSNRESQQVSEIEIRDEIIERMKAHLLERDSDLASHENALQDMQKQLEELCRVKRREDVNLDYLKSIVVQYLSLPPGSSERAGLLPVLATLLQFNDGDYSTIEDGKNKLSWWGSIAPTYIGGSLDAQSGSTLSSAAPVGSKGGSAELSTSSASQRPGPIRENGKGTSLQF